VSRRSISHAGTRGILCLRIRFAPVTFLNSRLKRGEIPREWWRSHSEGGTEREKDFIFSPGDIIARNYFLSPTDRWRGAREIAPRLALISSVAISLGPAPSGPSRKRRRERRGSLPFTIFLSPFLFIPLSLSFSLSLSRRIRISVRSDKRGSDTVKVIRGTTM